MDGKVDSKENRQIEPNQIVTEAAFNWYNNICSAVESRFSGFDNPSTYYIYQDAALETVNFEITVVKWKYNFVIANWTWLTFTMIITKVINDVK